MINYRTLENLDKHNILIIKIFFESKIICYILTGLTEASPQFDYVPQPDIMAREVTQISLL